MKKLICIALLGLGVAQVVLAQQALTTFILVRHAEKDNDGTNDPDLTAAGRQRAEALVSLLRETPVDAIYSTPYKRTKNTVQPLASAKELSILSYEPMKGEALDGILTKFKGGTVVMCGHSNTTPWVANYFLGKETFSTFEDSDYDNILVLTVAEKGVAKVSWFNYGAASN